MGVDEEAPALRVAVVEDQPLFRGMISALLKSDERFSLVLSAESVEQARRLILPGSADVLLLDIELPDGNGFGLGVSLRNRDPGLGIVLLSSHDMLEVLLGLPPEQRGGWSYLSKTSSSSPALLARALLASSRGETVLDPDLMQRRTPRAGSPLAALGERQFQALQLLGEGLSNIAIAEEMSISTHSVENILGSVYTALDVRADSSKNPRVAAALMMIEYSARGRSSRLDDHDAG